MTNPIELAKVQQAALDCLVMMEQTGAGGVTLFVNTEKRILRVRVSDTAKGHDWHPIADELAVARPAPTDQDGE